MHDQQNNTSPSTLRIGLTQWHATRDLDKNLEIACKLITNAAAAGADLITLPENGLYLGTNKEMRAAALSVDGAEISALRTAAKRARTPVVLGGFKRKSPHDAIYNTALVIGSDGEVAGGYDKVHLFNAKINGHSFEASGVELAGDNLVYIEIKGISIGLSICYDIRFPELFRRLAASGSKVILTPSAFTHTTGLAHWETLIRARAIENAVYMIASATVRGAGGDDAFETYGHAMAVDPWGIVLEDMGIVSEGFRVVTIDTSEVDRVRNILPVLKEARTEVYQTVPQCIYSAK